MARNNRELKYDKQMLVLTTTNDHEFIKSVAEKNDMSMGDVIRKLIEKLKEKEELQNELAIN